MRTSASLSAGARLRNAFAVPPRLVREERVLPRAPAVGGSCPHGRVGVLQQARVGAEEVAVAVGGGDAGPKPFPPPREEPAGPGRAGRSPRGGWW
jgi:hypothetical protein